MSKKHRKDLGLRLCTILWIVRMTNLRLSECRETHVQKIMYILSEIFDHTIPYTFSIYKGSPFSYSLRDDIGKLLSRDFLRATAEGRRWYSLLLGKNQAKYVENCIRWIDPHTRERIQDAIGKILDDNPSAEDLELLATAVWVVRKEEGVRQLNEFLRLKPQVKTDEALGFIERAKSLIKELSEMKKENKGRKVDSTGPSRPKREVCKVCGRVNRVGFHVPDWIWEKVVPREFRNKVVCLDCFTAWADEAGVQWDEHIKLYPVSLATILKEEERT